MNTQILAPSAAYDSYPEDAHLEDDESVGDHHRAAAHHFAQAAQHHLAAAEAEDQGDTDAADLHAYRAYQHRLNAVQYAEIAAMDSERDDDVLESEL